MSNELTDEQRLQFARDYVAGMSKEHRQWSVVVFLVGLLDARDARIKELEARAQHTDDCPAYWANRDAGDERACDCGLASLLTATPSGDKAS